MGKIREFYNSNKKVVSIGLLLLVIMVTYSFVMKGSLKEQSLDKFTDFVYSEKIKDVKGEILIDETSSIIQYTYKDKKYNVQFPAGRFLTTNNKDETILERLSLSSAEVKIKSLTGTTSGSNLMKLIYYAFLGLIAYYLIKSMGVFGGFEVGKVTDEKTRFSDIAGYKYIIEEMKDIVDYIHNPSDYAKYIDDVPSNVLLEGPPGTGKTTLAKAIAGESNSVFFEFSGADIEDKFIGSGSNNINKVFKAIRKHLKSNPKDKVVLFVDELDSFGMNRESRTVVETNQTLNKFLTEVEGFTKNENVIIVAATNLAKSLDPALVSRFGKTIEVPLPNQKDREEVIELYLNKKADMVHPEIKEENFIYTLAQRTQGFSNRDLNTLIKESSMISKKSGKGLIDIDCLRESLTKMIAGVRREHEVSEEERRLIAYHEAGHATAQIVLNEQGYKSVAYITITPYGKSLGHVAPVSHNQVLMRKTHIENEIKMTLAGRAVEEVLLNGDYTTGAASDLQQVNDKLKRYISTYGMSSRMENMYIEKVDENNEFIQKELQHHRQKFYEETKQLIAKHYDIVEKIAEHLLKHESINQHEIPALLESTSYKL